MSIKGKVSVTVLRREYTGAEDERGNEIPTNTSFIVTRCLIGYGGTSDVKSVIQEGITTAITIYFPQGTAIKEDDRFTINGKTYVKKGQTIEWETILGSPIKPKVIVEATLSEG